MLSVIQNFKKVMSCPSILMCWLITVGNHRLPVFDAGDFSNGHKRTLDEKNTAQISYSLAKIVDGDC